VVKDGSFEVDPLEELFLDEEDGVSWLIVPLLFICNSLGDDRSTFNLTSGGVNVKMPSLGILTPLPIFKLRLI